MSRADGKARGKAGKFGILSRRACEYGRDKSEKQSRGGTYQDPGEPALSEVEAERGRADVAAGSVDGVCRLVRGVQVLQQVSGRLQSMATAFSPHHGRDKRVAARSFSNGSAHTPLFDHLTLGAEGPRDAPT